MPLTFASSSGARTPAPVWAQVARGLALVAVVLLPAAACLAAPPWMALATAPASAWLAWRVSTVAVPQPVHAAAQTGVHACDDAALQRTTSGTEAAPDAPAARAGADAPTPAGDLQSLSRLTVQVVPVWQRNVEAARAHSEQSAAQLLESFGNVAGELDQALAAAAGGPQLDLDAADELVERHRADVDRLLEVARAAHRLKDEMLQVVAAFEAELACMEGMAREVQTVGRTTHMVALNISVEAARAGGASSTFMAVAHDVRGLAAQARGTGDELGRRIAAMRGRIDELVRSSRRESADEDELRQRAEQAARAVVAGLVHSLTEAGGASQGLTQAGRQLQQDLERIFVGLQSQDRLSQMLGSVTEDMARLAACLHGVSDPAAAHPSQWLQRLEATYTMEDMRASHQGNAAIQPAPPSVEFF